MGRHHNFLRAAKAIKKGRDIIVLICVHKSTCSNWDSGLLSVIRENKRMFTYLPQLFSKENCVIDILGLDTITCCELTLIPLMILYQQSLRTPVSKYHQSKLQCRLNLPIWFLIICRIKRGYFVGLSISWLQLSLIGYNQR